MDDAHSAFLTIAVLFINFSIHSFNSAIKELNNSDIEDDRRSEKIKYYMDNLDKVYCCTYIINALSGIFLGGLFFKYVKNYLEKSVNTSPVMTDAIIFFSIAVFCLLFIALGITVPNRLAIKSPKQYVHVFINIANLLMIIFAPLIMAINGMSYILLRIFGVDTGGQSETVSEEDIVSMINEGHEQGVFEGSEAEMITNIFELNDKTARDVMTHRKSVVFVDGEDTLKNVVDFLLNTGKNSRYPVYDENIDSIMGILNMKDALICENTTDYKDTAIKNIPNLLRNTIFVPENKNLDILFKEMQSHKNHMVVVVDEYGQTSGIVTMEDILEEIVGNIMDEYDEDEELIKELADGSYIVKGMAALNEIEEILKIKFDDEELENFDTLNGLIISRLDRIPEDGEKFDIIMHGCEFKVLHVSNKMINTVKVTKLHKDDDLKAE